MIHHEEFAAAIDRYTDSLPATEILIRAQVKIEDLEDLRAPTPEESRAKRIYEFLGSKGLVPIVEVTDEIVEVLMYDVPLYITDIAHADADKAMGFSNITLNPMFNR